MKTPLLPALFLGLLMVVAKPGAASTCKSPDNETSVQGSRHCLVIGTTAAAQQTETLVVVLHGDQSRGGPVDYVFRFAERLAGPTVSAVGMVRPGYAAGGRQSSGTAARSQSRDSLYRLDEINSIGAAIARLKAHHRAERLILAGHSGGALIAGVLLGSQPDLADGAILISCPCNVPKWRLARGREPLRHAQSPHKWLDRVRADVRIVAITGREDRNTFPRLAKEYIGAARDRGLQAEFVEVAGAEHSLARPLLDAAAEALHGMFGKGG